jgi:hypothetical protein
LDREAAFFFAGAFLAGAFFVGAFFTAFFAVITGFFATFRFAATTFNWVITSFYPPLAANFDRLGQSEAWKLIKELPEHHKKLMFFSLMGASGNL